jgi:hypothetical protein
VRGRSSRAGAGARGGSDWLGSRDSSVFFGYGCWRGAGLPVKWSLMDGSSRCGSQSSVAGCGLVQYTAMGELGALHWLWPRRRIPATKRDRLPQQR